MLDLEIDVIYFLSLSAKAFMKCFQQLNVV